jgi:hypothetical protein
MRYGLSATLLVAACLFVDPFTAHDAESEERKTLTAAELAQSVHLIARPNASSERRMPFEERIAWASLRTNTSSDAPMFDLDITGGIGRRDAASTSTEQTTPQAAAAEARSGVQRTYDPGHVTPEAVCQALVAAAVEHDLPIGFMIRLIWQESRFSPWAVSPVGAQGVAQFMPATANAMGLEDPFDPLQALPYSAKLLRELRAQFGNLGLAAAAYNAGPARVVDWLKKRRKLPEETRNYVTLITGHAPDRWRDSDADNPLATRLSSRVPCASLDDTPEYIPPPREKPLIADKEKPSAKKALLARAQDAKRKAESKDDAQVASKTDGKRSGKQALAARTSKGAKDKLDAPLKIANAGGKSSGANGEARSKKTQLAERANGSKPAKTRLARAD